MRSSHLNVTGKKKKKYIIMFILIKDLKIDLKT